MRVDHLNLTSKETHSTNGKILKIKKGKKYSVSALVSGKKGKNGCAYFAIILLDENKNEVERKIRWIKDFSGNPCELKIIFEASTENVIFCYRVNSETLTKSDCELEITPVNDIVIEECADGVEQSFETFGDCRLPRPPVLSEEEEQILEKNLVWLLGVGRSGTTWLGTQLLSYNTFFVDESQIGLHLGSITNGMQEKQIRNFETYGDSADYIFGKMYKDTWGYYLKKLILYRFYSQFRDLSKKIIIKEPSASMVADILSDVLPNSKMIFLVRDGRDVVDSTVDAFKKNTWLTKTGVIPRTEKDRKGFIHNVSRGWLKRNQIMLDAFQNHKNENKILIRYEELLENTYENLKKIYEFMGVEISKNELEKLIDKFSFKNIPKDQKGSGKFVRSASPGKWKENFTDEEITIMENIMNPMLKKLNYV